MNVDRVTITINMVDPEIGTKIYPWIFYRQALHRPRSLADPARTTDAGPRMLTARRHPDQDQLGHDPGVNDEHLVEVNRWVKERGASCITSCR